MDSGTLTNPATKARGLVVAGPVARYVTALLAMLLAIGVRMLFQPILSGQRPYLTIFGGVALAVWLARWRAATVAAVAAFLLVHFVIEPHTPETNSFVLSEFVLYAISAGFIIVTGEAMHRARERAEHEAMERAATEESERRQKDLLGVTLASIGDGVVVTDASGGVLSLNPEAERLTGWSEAAARGRPLTEVFRIVNEQTRQPVENPVELVIRRGTTVGLANHTVLIAQNGAEVPIDDSAAPIRDRNGALVGIVLVFRDVREQRATQLSRARLAAIVESSGEAIVTKNLDGIIQTWNESAAHLFGYRPEEAIGKPVTMIIPPDHLNEELEILSRIRNGRPVERFETVRIAKDGTHIPVAITVSPIRDADGHVIGASKIAHDITEVIAARDALAEEKELLGTTLASIGDAVITTDADGRITSMNPVAESLTGWSAGDALDRPLADVFHIVNEETREKVENPAERALREGVIVGLANHTVLIRKDGEELPIDDSAAPIRHRSGSIAGCVLVFRDIARRRESERVERAARAEAEEASRLKDDFLATLSHELRTPLNAIIGWTHLMQRSSLDHATMTQGVEVIARNARLQADLIADLLDMSRIVSGKLPLEVGDVDLAEVVANSLDVIRPSADGKQLKVGVVIDPSNAPIRGDASRIQQILWNLLSNAVKFTPEGGSIDVAVTRHGSFAEVVVRDSGIGIGPALMPHLFKRFRQGDSSASRSHGGLGLGLAIVKHLVELHG
ncbi:MAG TPA: PAS domain S-box protein, partial [Gemmatimonadaceae bacterium]|nr:PAS domain S-box protein [Gemmatimonadaceae bacterium]